MATALAHSEDPAGAPPPGVELATERLRMRAWRDADREPFAALNADPAVMEFFPALIGREASNTSIDAWQADLAQRGWGNWAVERRDTGEFIGFVGISVPRRVLPCSPCVEIGWRLGRAHWGNGFATEAAQRALGAGFTTAGLGVIVSFTSVRNHRSRVVMQRIGMQDLHQDFDHPGVDEGSPLRLHCLYSITREHWLERASLAASQS